MTADYTNLPAHLVQRALNLSALALSLLDEARLYRGYEGGPLVRPAVGMVSASLREALKAAREAPRVTVESVAQKAYDVWRARNGDLDLPPWDEAPEGMRDDHMANTRAVLRAAGCGPNKGQDDDDA